MTTQPDISAIEVDAETVNNWLDGQQAVLVDVRETTEYEQEHIPGSVLVPLSVFDPERFPWITAKKLVFHCAVGKRSAAAAKQLMQEGHPQLYNLAGGINAWKEAGLVTEIQFIPAAAPHRRFGARQMRRHPGYRSASRALFLHRRGLLAARPDGL